MARVIFFCDYCEAQAEGEWYGSPPSAHKPRHWFQRSDKDGVQVVCSRTCIDLLAEKTGKTNIVVPM